MAGQSVAEFITPDRILFGVGCAQQVPDLVRGLASHVMVVCGATPDRHEWLFRALRDRDIAISLYSLRGEPSVADVESALALARQHGATALIGIGGGSVLDVAKAVAALLSNGGEVRDYLEVVGRGQALQRRAAPTIAIPTTAGTGSEATRNAVLEVAEQGVKVSMRSPLMVPTYAVVDPELTLTLPPLPTATSGFDALAQLIEAFVSRKATPFTDALCREGLRRVAHALRRVCDDGSDLDARFDMALGALFSGVALANGGLGAVHGFAGPLGAMLHAPHGALCAALLGPTIAVNVAALRLREPLSPALERYAEIAQIVLGDHHDSIAKLVEWVERLACEVGIPRLTDLGFSPNDIPKAIERARVASSMKGNPVVLTDEELTEILVRAQ